MACICLLAKPGKSMVVLPINRLDHA
jgi:hypothetical protein